MNFECLSLLGLNHSLNLLGNTFHYRNTKNFSIKGYVDNSGVISETIEPIWDKITNLLNFTGHQDIYINSCYVGYGRMKSISFDESTDTSYRTYNCDLEIFESGDLYNMSGQYSSVYSILQTNGKYVNSISNNQTFTKGQKDSLLYGFDLNIEIDQSYSGNRSDLAKEFYLNFRDSFSYSGLISAIYPSFYGTNGIKYNNETYNEILGTYSFSTNFSYQSGLPYLWEYSNNISFDGSDVSVSENGKIKATRFPSSSSLRDNYNYLDYALDAWSDVKTGIFERCNSIYNFYLTNLTGITDSCSGDLNNYLISSTINQNAILGEIEYSNNYSNSKIYESGFYHSYSNDISYDEYGFTLVSIGGEIKGKSTGNENKGAIFSEMYSNYLTVKNNISGDASGIYFSYKIYDENCFSGNLVKNSSDESYSIYNSSISYKFNFSDNPYYIDDEDVFKVISKYTDNKPVNIVNHFAVVNDGVYSQSSNQSTRGEFVSTVDIVGKSNLTVQEYVDLAKTKVITPSGTDSVLQALSVNFSPLNKKFSLSANYSYSDYRSINDILI